jgi:hypothetical protein
MSPIIKSAFEKVAPGRFRINFYKLRHLGMKGLVSRFTDQDPVEVDPYLVAQAVSGVIRLCTSRGTNGQPLVWNEYKVFLSSADHELLQPLKRRLLAGLDTVVGKTLDQLAAETVGDPMIWVLVDDRSDVAKGTADIEAGFVENTALADPQDGEMTVRLPRHRRTAGKAPTEPMSDPATAGHLRLTWELHQALVAPQQKVQLGRPHIGSPERFVALIGASRRINRCQLSIENMGDTVIITRHRDTNPVQVSERVLQPGGKLSLAELPVTLSLSSGSLDLRLERVGGK